jgi:tetratricopeptide (TPR) repeat protein/predicted Ser/Thr protein kinase
MSERDPARSASPESLLASLAAEFESEWTGALEGREPPHLNTYLERVVGDTRGALRDQLIGIDCRFRPRWLSSRVAVAAAGQSVDPSTDNFAATTALRGKDEVPPLPGQADAELGQRNGAGVLLPETIELRPKQESVRSARDLAAGPPAIPAPQVPGYEILGELGRGGMGVVYRARQQGLNRLVALKMIIGGEHADAGHVARFRAEAETVARFQHPNIVQIYEVGQQQGLPYFSLEFIDGPPLSHECRGIALLPERATELLESIARAMHYAHSRGIVHRDLKPANILLTREGVPKVSDFGLFKQFETDEGQTRTGAVMGTPSFMAPEQARGDQRVTPLADVYSLGAVLYNLLTGRPPFLAATAVDTVIQVLNADPVPPSRLQPTTPKDLETICLKCLQKDSQNRYASAEELADDLRRFRAGEPIHARPVGIGESVWRWCRRNPRVAATAAVAALLALALMIGGPTAAAIIYQQKRIAVNARNEAGASEQRALQARNVAMAAERDAIQARELAEVNEQKAVESRKVAETQGRLALDSLRSLVSEVQGELASQPRLQPLRRRLLQTALIGLDKVASQGVDANIKEMTMAGAYRRMGDIYLELGQTDKALQQYQQCHAILEHLAGRNSLPNMHHNLSYSQLNLGDAALRGGNLQLAKTCFLEAVETRRAWALAEPDNTMVPQNTAAALGKLGNACLALGQLPEARTALEESLALREQWEQREPENLEARQEAAGARNAMGRISLSLGRLDDAEQFSKAALDTIVGLLERQPNSRPHHWNTALFSSQLGAIQLMAAKPADAVVRYQRALDILDELSRQDPQNALLRRHLAEAQYGIASSYAELGNPAANEHYQAALQLRKRLAEDDPNSAEEQTGLMLSLASCGQHAEASQIAQQLRSSHASDGYVLYKTAAGLALCASAVAQQLAAGDPASGLAQLQEHYAAQAVETLQASIASGFQITAEAAIDPDLKSLRARDDFRNLVSQAR